MPETPPREPSRGQPISPPAPPLPVSPLSAPAPAQGGKKVVPGEKQPFPFRAATYSLWLPLAAIVFGCVSNTAVKGANEAGTDPWSAAGKIIIGLMSLVLLLSSVVLAIIALCGIPKYGRKGILGRAIAGLAISGGFLIASGYLIWFITSYPNVLEKRLVGVWKENMALPGGNVRVTLTLGADRHGHIRFDSAARSMDVDGEWKVLGSPASAQPSRLLIKFDAGHDASLGDGVTWDIDSIQDRQMSLQGKQPNGTTRTELFQRDGT